MKRQDVIRLIEISDRLENILDGAAIARAELKECPLCGGKARLISDDGSGIGSTIAQQKETGK